MISWNPGFVYLLYKKGHKPNGKVYARFFVWVPDMDTVETALHDRFASSRYKSLKDVPWHGNFQKTCKIGLTSRPVHKRVFDINKDWKSGHTEWFALKWTERLFVRWWMRWYAVRWFLLLITLIIVVNLISKTF